MSIFGFFFVGSLLRKAYVRRAKRGAMDAALVTGTGQDRLQAVAKHVLVTKYSTGPPSQTFPPCLHRHSWLLAADFSLSWRMARSKGLTRRYTKPRAMNALRK
jgi:hypothetical protein